MVSNLTYAPRLLPAQEAAHYLGVSVTTLRNLGIPRRHLQSKRLYDRMVLDAYASNLPSDDVEGESCAEANKAFGLKA